MTGNTILITGGSSGIGFALARLLAPDNIVIITGCDPAKLAAAKAELRTVHTYVSDVSDPIAITEFRQQLTQAFPALKVLINNAGIMRKLSFLGTAGDLTDLTRAIDINLDGPIRMVAEFLPHLKKQNNAALLNMSSGLAFVPFPISPVYSATKAGLHAFTLALRVQMRNQPIKIFELCPPAIETPLLRGDFDAVDMGSIGGMDVARLAQATHDGMQRDRLEIRPGLGNILKLMSRVAPAFILGRLTHALSRSLTRMEIA